MTEQATANAVTEPETVMTEESTVSIQDTVPEDDDAALGAVFDKYATEFENDDFNSTDHLSKPVELPRDDKGRFATAEKSGTEEGVQDAQTEQDGEVQGKEGSDEQADKGAEVASPPAHLPYDLKANWSEIPPQARDALLALTTEQDRKFGELGREMEAYKPIKQVESEFKEYFDGTKGSYKPAEAMRYMFGLQRQMDENPLGTIYKIAETYGVANQLAQPTDGSHQIASLTQTIRELQSRLDKQADPNYINTAVSNALEERDFDKALKGFADSKPFYAEVEADLPTFISVARNRLGDTADPMKVLEAAYEMAEYAIPEVRAKAQAAKATQNAGSDVSKAANGADPKRTESAKRAASINVKSTQTGKTHFATEEEAMSAAFDRAMSAA